MQAVMEAGYNREEELRILNWYRCHQQVLHLSDVLDFGGRALDKKYMTH